MTLADLFSPLQPYVVRKVFQFWPFQNSCVDVGHQKHLSREPAPASVSAAQLVFPERVRCVWRFFCLPIPTSCGIAEQSPEELGVGSLAETYYCLARLPLFRPDLYAVAKAMGTPAEEDGSTSPKDGEWPEVEKAEKLARGAALKWASGVFCCPDKLESLGKYFKREKQRNTSIQSRIKSTVQSYLEGVDVGLESLHSAAAEVHQMQKELGSIQRDFSSRSGFFHNLQELREVVENHAQLVSVVQMLPQLSSVHRVLSEAFEHLQGHHLLEAHVRLMALESLRDEILSHLHEREHLNPLHLASVESYFGGLLDLNDALAKHLWRVVARGTRLVSEDPALFVSALRIIEREEGLDALLLPKAQPPGFLPPGRPKCWRQKFFEVIRNTIVASHFQAIPSDTQRQHLSRHFASFQSCILEELCIVKDLMVQCCPPHYDILTAFVSIYHQGLAGHLRRILTWDLEKKDIFALLHWAIHVYPSSEMMAHPSLLPDVDISVLGPLLPLEEVELLEEAYVVKVEASVTQWMKKMLEMEFKEWFSGGKPESDYQGCFQTSLPFIVMKMLAENNRAASLISDSLQQKVCDMTLDRLDSFLSSLYRKLVEFGDEHRKEPLASKCFTSYVVATINNCLALSTSVSALCTNGRASREPPEMPPSLKVTLEKTQKKACQLLLEEVSAELQPLFAKLLSPPWLTGESQLAIDITKVIDKHAREFCRAQRSINMYLLSETEHLVVYQYIRSLLQKRMACQNAEERSWMARRMLLDASQLKEFFGILGLEDDKRTLEVIADLQELLNLKDSSMLGLEVLGFMTKYPDVSDDHISMLLNLRGDISKETRNHVLEMMAQNPQVPRENSEPLFSHILVPAPEPHSCLGKAKCA